MENHSDIFIIGGGINGTAIAADAAGRGLSVTLCEQHDLGSGTSSASSKLIHGGLRYLELYEFGLVHKALREREILMNRAPHLVTPLEFILPYETHLRPAWMIRLGLFIYDHLAKRVRLPASKQLDLKNDLHGSGLLSHLQKGFSYYDCFTDDSRLVILNALSAKEHQATILTRTEFITAKRQNNYWQIQLKNTLSQQIFYCSATTLINVAGPWVKNVANQIEDTDIQFDIELDKGSHIVVPKLYEGDFAFILQNKDKRIIFAIPYQKDFTLIGTTDVKYSGNLNKMIISTEEENYLCQIINQYFQKTIHHDDILWSYAGVRCLQASHTPHSPATATRDYKFFLENKNNLPLLTVIGGKLTTHRTLAENTLTKLKDFFANMGPNWTSEQPLPGGDFANQNFNDFNKELGENFPWLADDIAARYAKSYGTLAYTFLHSAHSIADLGIDFAHGLYQKEVEYLIQHEWAMCAEDILWRRSKLGLLFSKSEVQRLENWIQENYEDFKTVSTLP